MINSLPELVLALIFSNLIAADRIRKVSLVCKRWKVIVYTCAVRKTVDLTGYENSLRRSSTGLFLLEREIYHVPLRNLGNIGCVRTENTCNFILDSDLFFIEMSRGEC